MLFDNQGGAKRNHEEDTERSADCGDDGNGHKGRGGCDPLFCPEKDGGQGEDGSCCDRFSCRTDCLHHVILQDGVLAQDDADDTHGNDRRRNGGGNGHSDPQPQVGVCGTEDNRHQHADDHGGDGHFRRILICRNEGLERLI